MEQYAKKLATAVLSARTAKTAQQLTALIPLPTAAQRGRAWGLLLQKGMWLEHGRLNNNRDTYAPAKCAGILLEELYPSRLDIPTAEHFAERVDEHALRKYVDNRARRTNTDILIAHNEEVGRPQEQARAGRPSKTQVEAKKATSSADKLKFHEESAKKLLDMLESNTAGEAGASRKITTQKRCA